MTTIPLYTGLAARAAFRGLATWRLAHQYPTEKQVWLRYSSTAFKAARVIGGAR